MTDYIKWKNLRLLAKRVILCDIYMATYRLPHVSRSNFIRKDPSCNVIVSIFCLFVLSEPRYYLCNVTTLFLKIVYDANTVTFLQKVTGTGNATVVVQPLYHFGP